MAVRLHCTAGSAGRVDVHLAIYTGTVLLIYINNIFTKNELCPNVLHFLIMQTENPNIYVYFKYRHY